MGIRGGNNRFFYGSKPYSQKNCGVFNFFDYLFLLMYNSQNMEDQKKRLYRSRENKMIFGVARGIADYFGIDPVLVRVLFVLLALLDGMGILLYFILALVMPASSRTSDTTDAKSENQTNKLADDVREALGFGLKKRNAIGIIFVTIGVLLLFRDVFDFDWFRGDIIFPSLVIVFGIWLIFKKK